MIAKNLGSSGDVQHVRAIRAISHKLVQTEGYWESLYDACHQAEAIIYHYTAPQGFHLAEKFGIPSVVAAIAPLGKRSTRDSTCWTAECSGTKKRILDFKRGF